MSELTLRLIAENKAKHARAGFGELWPLKLEIEEAL